MLVTFPFLNASKSHLKVAVPIAILNSGFFCKAVIISFFTLEFGGEFLSNFLLDGIALLKKEVAL